MTNQQVKKAASFFGPGWRGRIIFLLIWWLPAAGLITIQKLYQEHSPDERLSGAGTENIIRSAKNEMVNFRLSCRDPEADNQTIFSISFDRLQSENGRLGIFNTAAHKVLNIQNLWMRSFEYISQEGGAKNVVNIMDVCQPGRFLDKKSAPDNEDEVSEKLNRIISEWFSEIDLSNALEARIDGFNYQHFNNGVAVFTLRSKKARIALGSNNLLLRGHVFINTANGDTLESNHVRWDPKSRLFIISGGYVIERNGIKTTGEAACVDSQLNIIPAQNT